MKNQTNDFGFMKVLGLVFVLLFTFSIVSAIAPDGATITNVSSQRADKDPAGYHEALAGNLTEISITGFSPTQAWAGFYGNVSGTIELAYTTGGDDKVMYNWTLANPRGEVYAAQSSSIDWRYVQCFNYTAVTGDMSNCQLTAGESCEYGMNLTELESHFTIAADDIDGVDETFTISGSHEHGGGNTHSLFYTNNLEFSEGQCHSTRLFDSTGNSNDAVFEQVLLYDPFTELPGFGSNKGMPIFVSIIESTNVDGFDGRDHDFQMLVLEDGHGTNTATTTYYFYVALE